MLVKTACISIFLFVIILTSLQYVEAGEYTKQKPKIKLYSVEGLFGGLVYGQRLKHEDYKLKYKPQFVVSLILNRKVKNNISLFAQIINQFWTKSTGNYTQAQATYKAIFYYKSISLLLGGKYHFSSIKKFTPYIKAGIGIASNRSYERHWRATSVNFNAEYSKATKNNFAYLIGIGIKKRIYNKIDWLLEYDYFDGGKVTTSKTLRTGIVTTAHEPITDGIKNHYILTGISYEF